jgi:hypothetical protein
MPQMKRTHALGSIVAGLHIGAEFAEPHVDHFVRDSPLPIPLPRVRLRHHELPSPPSGRMEAEGDGGAAVPLEGGDRREGAGGLRSHSSRSAGSTRTGAMRWSPSLIALRSPRMIRRYTCPTETPSCSATSGTFTSLDPVCTALIGTDGSTRTGLVEPDLPYHPGRSG